MNATPLLFLKPVLTALIAPPAGPLLVVFAGLLIGIKKRTVFKKISHSLVLTGSVLLWILCCEDTAVWMSETLLPQFAPITQENLKNAQVILVLGGGTESFAPAYAGAELTVSAYDRLRYAVYLSKRSGLAIAYAGGKGWGDLSNSPSEAEVARATLKRDWNTDLKFWEGTSRDTRENAVLSFAVLSAQGVTRIALVTHAWHMPRASRNFKQAGFEVIPAPMGFITHSTSPILDVLPSEGGLQDSRWVFKEWLGMLLT